MNVFIYVFSIFTLSTALRRFFALKNTLIGLLYYRYDTIKSIMVLKSHGRTHLLSLSSLSAKNAILCVYPARA
jgi:hypothetical protein